jgi:hypothetical protein
MKTREYKAELSFSVIEKGSSSGGGMASLAGQFGFNVGSSGGGVFSGNNMIELLQSRNLIERTLLHEMNIKGEKRRIIDYYREINPPEDDEDNQNKKEITFPSGLDRVNFSREQDSLLFVLNKGITTKKLSIEKQKKDVDIINLSFQNEDELFAKIFTETLISIVSEFYIQIKTKNTKVNLEIMEARADSIKKEWDEALVEGAKYLDQNINPSKQILRVEQTKIQTKIQITGATYLELVKNIEILKLDLVQQTPLIQIIDAPIMPLALIGFGKIKGIILGGFLGGFLIVGWLLAVYFYRRIMQE